MPKHHRKGENRGQEENILAFTQEEEDKKPVPFFEMLPVSQRVRQARLHDSAHKQKKGFRSIPIWNPFLEQIESKEVSCSYTQIKAVYLCIKVGGEKSSI